ncbi:MAG TPA: class I SAM-dependent methyltransferase [Solirubrobacterales bacterium]|nr:class I SAM-dependent methyltransferase [Solirubrobacterales bacterium]
MTASTDLEQVKEKQQATWSSGDYGRIAWLTVPLGDVLCEAVDVRPGSRVLDVATGTGHVALAAARRFCDATGVDYVPALIETARRRAEAEALEVDFRAGDAERLPFDDGSFDYVLSAIGVMFTADHERAAGELTRVCRAGGTVGLVSWTPTGFIGRMLKTVGSHVSPPPGVEPPPRWGTEEYVRELLGDRVADPSFSTGSITQRFPSPEFFADFFIEHYGPTRKASEALDNEGRAAFRADLVELATQMNRSGDETAMLDWEYLVTVAPRA